MRPMKLPGTAFLGMLLLSVAVYGSPYQPRHDSSTQRATDSLGPRDSTQMHNDRCNDTHKHI
jgi:hypothetical protein